MASLKWVVHSACHVLGYPTTDQESSVCHGEGLKLKAPNGNNNVVGLSYKKADEAFQMPLHYPRYTKADYEKMEEWRLDVLLAQYGLSLEGSLDAKRDYAKGAFLWPDQC